MEILVGVIIVGALACAGGIGAKKASDLKHGTGTLKGVLIEKHHEYKDNNCESYITIMDHGKNTVISVSNEDYETLDVGMQGNFKMVANKFAGFTAKSE